MSTHTEDSGAERESTIGELAASMEPGDVRHVLGYRVEMIGWFPLAEADQ